MAPILLLRPVVSATTLAAAFLSCIGFAPGGAAAASIVANGSFNTPSGTGPTTLTADANGGEGPSATKYWAVFNDNAGTTTTELLPSPNVPGGNMIHVTTTNDYGGLYQIFPATGPSAVYTCDRICINQGAVGIGTGLGADTMIDATLFKTGSWEVLNVGNQSQPVYETIHYSQGGPADFYVESVKVSTTHQQCSPS